MAIALTIALIFALTLLLLSLLSFAYFKFIAKLNNFSSPQHDVEQPEPYSVSKPSIRRFKPTEIDTITSTLTPANIIGHGGFSTVHSTTISNPHSLVAIKIHHSSHRLHLAFHQELNILLQLNHPHIVRILGYCDQKPEEGILVFEYIPNGNLHDNLHSSVSAPLSWSQRTSIALKLALALDYLHEGSDLQIIHGDIKSSNVLLDEKLSPKLCDFGSARMGFSGTVIGSGDKWVMGSPGYVDPHYIRTGLVSKKSDIYSFGVLVLELVTGMEAFCEEEQKLLTAVVGLVGEEIRGGEFVDPKLGGEYDEDEVKVMLGISAKCIGLRPVHRPSMGDVVKIMSEKLEIVVDGR